MELTNTDKAIFGGVYAITHKPTGQTWTGVTCHYSNRIRVDVAMLQEGLFPDAELQAAWTRGRTRDFAWRLSVVEPVVELGAGKYAIRQATYDSWARKPKGSPLQHSIDAIEIAKDARGKAFGYVSWDEEHAAYCELSSDPNSARRLDYLYYHVAGVYGIHHVKHELRYVGQSDKVTDRFRCHLSDLHKGTHHNRHLSASYVGDGDARNLAWTLIEIVDDVATLESREHHYWTRQRAREIAGKCMVANVEDTDPATKKSKKVA